MMIITFEIMEQTSHDEIEIFDGPFKRG